MYKIKVNTSGTKIAVFDNDKMVRVIDASKDTFAPYEAKSFAKGLYAKLNGNKVAAQMEDTGAKPSITNISELKTEIMDAVQEEAKGVSVIEASLKNEVASLRKANFELKRASNLERKARRGLAIAKVEVEAGKLEKSEKAVEERVAQIAGMDDEDIERLERKSSGLPEFENVKEANKYASKMQLKARSLKAEAEDAFKKGEDEEATTKECKANECLSKAEEASKIAKDLKDGEEDVEIKESKKDKKSGELEIEIEDESPEEEEAEEAEEEGENIGAALVNAYQRVAKLQSIIAKKASGTDDEVEIAALEESAEAKKKATILLQGGEEEKEATDDKEASLLTNLVQAYQRVASLQNLVAKKASDDEEVKESALEEAAEAKKKASILLSAEDKDATDDKEAEDKEASLLTNLVQAYQRVAKLQNMVAKKASDDEEVKDAADKEAEEAEKKASILLQAGEEEKVAEDDKEATDDKEASLLTNLVQAYQRVAKLQNMVAKKAEDDEEVKESALEEAGESEKKASILLRAEEKDAEDKEAADEDKEAKIEKKKAEDKEAEEEKVEAEDKKGEDKLSELVNAYNKIAKLQRAIAKQAEIEGEEAASDAADKEAEEAEKKAHILSASDDKEAEDKEAEEEEKVAEDKEAEDKEAEDKELEASLDGLFFMATDIQEKDAEDEDKVAEDKEAEEEEKVAEEKEEGTKEASRISSIKKYSDGVSKLAKVEQNHHAGNTVVRDSKLGVVDLESLWSR